MYGGTRYPTRLVRAACELPINSPSSIVVSKNLHGTHCPRFGRRKGANLCYRLLTEIIDDKWTAGLSVYSCRNAATGSSFIARRVGK
jgi:hypothetical protein